MFLRKIDELTRPDHVLLDTSSDCYYFADYPGGNRPENLQNPIYSLIHNLKKKPNRRNTASWRYKIEAIQRCSAMIIRYFERAGNIDKYSFVPIPPSKNKSNPLYDPRLVHVLEGVKERLPECDIRDLLSLTSDMVASHRTRIRPTIDELYQNYRLDRSQLFGIRENIILFDDMITLGAHFQAAKRKILDSKEDAKVMGIFISRCVQPE